MTYIREFTDQGNLKWEEFLREGRLDGYESFCSAVLYQDEYTVNVGEMDQLPHIPADATRYDAGMAALAVSDSLELTGIRASDALWSWYAAVNFKSLVKEGKEYNTFSSGSIALWIAESGDWKRYYRHRIAGPWWSCSRFRDDIEVALALLCTSATELPEVVEQIASRQEIAASDGAIAAATHLYYDVTTKKLKRGSGGKDAGSPRRYADFLNQIDRTYDLATITKDEILKILPAEFKRFM